MLNHNQIMHIFERTGALQHGHFLLSSGLHSSTYFQCALVLQYPQYAAQLGESLAHHFKELHPDLVISPAIGGIVIGQEVARVLGIRAIFAERMDGRMCLRRGFNIAPQEKAVVIEDVVTTGGSTHEVITLVKQNLAVPVGVGCIVDRSVGDLQFDISLKSLVKLEVQTFVPTDCMLCKDGVQLIKPGSRKIS